MSSQEQQQQQQSIVPPPTTAAAMAEPPKTELESVKLNDNVDVPRELVDAVQARMDKDDELDRVKAELEILKREAMKVRAREFEEKHSANYAALIAGLPEDQREEVWKRIQSYYIEPNKTPESEPLKVMLEAAASRTVASTKNMAELEARMQEEKKKRTELEAEVAKYRSLGANANSGHESHDPLAHVSKRVRNDGNTSHRANTNVDTFDPSSFYTKFNSPENQIVDSHLQSHRAPVYAPRDAMQIDAPVPTLMSAAASSTVGSSSSSAAAAPAHEAFAQRFNMIESDLFSADVFTRPVKFPGRA